MRMLAVWLIVVVLAPATAGAQVVIDFSNGKVTLHADNVPVRTILAEWSKRGGTRIINGDRVGGGPVTLELAGVPELQALEILLRGVAGYLVGRREIAATGPGLNNPSVFDRIHVLPTSTAPRTTAPAPAAPAPRVPIIRPPQPSLPDEDDLFIDEPPDREPRANGPGLQGGFNQTPRQVGAPVPPQNEDAPPPAPQPARGNNPFGAFSASPRPGVAIPAPPAQQNTPQTSPE